MKTVAASPALYFIMLRHRTLSPTIYLTEAIRKPFPYREYSSYPAEEKMLFSQRKMLLPVVVFFYLCT